MFDLKGKTALITGASRGIGRAFALELARCGADIVLCYAGNEEAMRQTADEIESLGALCTRVKADLTDPGCAEVIYSRAKHADILIHNASVQYRNTVEGITAEEFEKQVNCNFRAPFLLTQKYTGYMKKNGWGRIITIGSVQELKPHPEMLIYSSMKAALTNMARSLALQLAPYGITVNSIAPGVMLTDRNSEALSNESYREATAQKIPLGFFGEARECASLLALLCSDEGRYITGQNIFVDGGMGIR